MNDDSSDVSKKGPSLAQGRAGGKTCEKADKELGVFWCEKDIFKHRNTERKTFPYFPYVEIGNIYFRYQTRTELSNPILLQHYKNHPFTTV